MKRVIAKPAKRGTIYQIDQSGKIEQTNKPTIITLANGKTVVIKITAVEKQKLIRTIIDLRKPNKTYAYDIFSGLIFLVLCAHPVKEVQIDREYPGHEGGIKERLLQFFEKRGQKPPEISFALVGKKCNAHMVGLSVFQKKSKPDFTVKASDLLEVILGTKKGWRPQSSRGNL